MTKAHPITGGPDKKAKQAAKLERQARVREVLSLLLPLGPVEARSMFGGHGLYLEDIIFGLIGDQEIWLKVDAETKPAFRQAGSHPFVYTGKNRPVEMPYWAAPAGAQRTPDALLSWARLAVAAGRRASAKKRAAQRKKTERQQKALSILQSL